MEKQIIYRHVFEAFSSLSDAQDTVGYPLELSVQTAQERISHAKLHLMMVLEDDPEALLGAMSGMPLGCSLDPSEADILHKALRDVGLNRNLT